jgi:uncharacterized protein (TIGR00297 family)
MMAFLSGLILGSVIAALAYRFGALSLTGAAAAAALGAFVFYWGGLAGAILLVLFFGGSSLLTQAFPGRKRDASRHYAKGGARDPMQVLANGGVAGASLALYAYTRDVNWLFAFTGALAAANADTWATELGPLSSQQPRLATSGKRVPAGTSGAVSWVGSLASLAGAVFIALTGSWLFEIPRILLAGTLAGVLGSLVDSLLGACCQAVYYCPACRVETERSPEHGCGTAMHRIRGLAWLDNDLVNLLGTLAGAGSAFLAGWLL